MGSLLRFIADASRVRPEEARRTLLAALYLFFVISAFITARIARTVLFLEIPGYREQLPLTYVGIALTVGTVMYGYALVERRLRRDHTNVLTLGLVVGVTLVFRAALETNAPVGLVLSNPRHEVYWLFYLWVEIFGTLLIVQFWSFTNEIFHSRQAKRLFAVIGGGGVLANVVIGVAIRATVRSLGTENLLIGIAVCLGAAMMLVVSLGRDVRSELSAAKDRVSDRRLVTRGRGTQAFATRHVKLMAVVVVLIYVASTLVDYQFNVIVGDSIPTKNDRSAYFASFFTITGVIGGFLQFFVTARLLERFGVLAALLLLPVFMLAGTGLVVAAPFVAFSGLWAAALTKGAENCLRYTVNDSTLQLLYLPVPAQVRGRAKAVIDGVLKPVAIGGTGVALAVLVGRFDALTGVGLGLRLSPYDLGWLVAVGLVAWMGALLLLRREYVASLMQTLRRRRLNFADSRFRIQDESTLRTLQRALSSEMIGQVLHALELLPFVDRKARGSLNDGVVVLLHHESEEVRVAALHYLGRQDAVDIGTHLGELLDDPSGRVRAAAALAYCATMQGQALERVVSLLEDRDRQVKAAAIAGLVRDAGLDGVLASAEHLKAMLKSPDGEDRAYASWVLGEVGVQNFYQPLVPLLYDEIPRVRLAAIAAAGKLRHTALVTPLVESLSRPRLARAATHALVALGARTQNAVVGCLQDNQNPSGARAAACRVLGRLADNEGIEALMQHVNDTDFRVRAAAAAALRCVGRERAGATFRDGRIARALRNEAERWFVAVTTQQDLGTTGILMTDALEYRKRSARQQILDLLALLYPPDTIELVAQNLQSPLANRRANAVEVLDNLLEKSLKGVVLPVFDDVSGSRAVALGTDLFGLQPSPRISRLGRLLDGSEAWLQVCAAVEVGNDRLEELEPQMWTLLQSGGSLARETALATLKRLHDGNGAYALLERIQPFIHDDSQQVSRYAHFVIAHVGEDPR